MGQVPTKLPSRDRKLPLLNFNQAFAGLLIDSHTIELPNGASNSLKFPRTLQLNMQQPRGPYKYPKDGERRSTISERKAPKAVKRRYSRAL